MSLLKYREFSSGKISVISDNILYTEFYSTEQFGIEEAKQLDDVRLELCEGKPFYSLVGLVNVFGHMTKEAQYYLANESKSHTLVKHEVILVNSLSIRILVKYFIKFTKPKYNIEVMKDYQKGLDYLKALVAKDHDNHNHS